VIGKLFTTEENQITLNSKGKLEIKLGNFFIYISNFLQNEN